MSRYSSSPATLYNNNGIHLMLQAYLLLIATIILQSGETDIAGVVYEGTSKMSATVAVS